MTTNKNACSTLPNGGNLVEPDIRDPNITGEVELDLSAIMSIVEAICPQLEDCVVAHVEAHDGWDLNLNNLVVDGELTLSISAMASIVEEAIEAIAPRVPDMLTDATLVGISLKGATLDSGTVVGIRDALLQEPNKTVFMEAFKEEIATSMVELLAGATLDNVTINASTINQATLEGVTSNNGTLVDTRLSGTTVLGDDILFEDSAKGSIGRMVSEYLGIVKLISADGFQLDGTEGLVTKCILMREIGILNAKIERVRRQHLYDCRGEKLKDGDAVLTCEDAAERFEELRGLINTLTGGLGDLGEVLDDLGSKLQDQIDKNKEDIADLQATDKDIWDAIKELKEKDIELERADALLDKRIDILTEKHEALKEEHAKDSALNTKEHDRFKLDIQNLKETKMSHIVGCDGKPLPWTANIATCQEVQAAIKDNVKITSSFGEGTDIIASQMLATRARDEALKKVDKSQVTSQEGQSTTLVASQKLVSDIKKQALNRKTVHLSSTNGYTIWFGSNGQPERIEQWGQVNRSGATNRWVTWPYALPSAPATVQMTLKNRSSSGSKHNVLANNPTATGFNAIQHGVELASSWYCLWEKR